MQFFSNSLYLSIKFSTGPALFGMFIIRFITCYTHFLLLIVLYSCGNQQIERKAIMNEIDKAKALLYENKVDSAEKILNLIDTTLLEEHSLANYHLANSFLFHLTGQKSLASDHLNKCAPYYERYGNDLGKGEWHLINGYTLETALLYTEAAQSYLLGMQYLTREKCPEQYFKCLLGIIRTTNERGDFLKEAETFVETNPTKRNIYLLLSTKSLITSDKRQKLNLLLGALAHYDQDFNARNLVRLYSNLAKIYQALDEMDSARYYITMSELVISKGDIKAQSLAHYYLIRARIEYKNGCTEEALETLSRVFELGADRPGIMAYAYLQRSGIYRTIGNYAAENDDLSKYIKYLKLEFDENKHHQIALLRYTLILQKKELEIMQTRQLMFWSGAGFLLIVISGWLMFKNYQMRVRRKRIELEQMQHLTATRLTEQIELNMSGLKPDNDEVGISPIHNGNGHNNTTKKMQDFYAHFNIYYPFFRQKLTSVYPNLSGSDLKYCDCIMAQLTMQQTTDMLSITESAVKKARKKLKIFFKCGSMDELFMKLKRINDKPTIFEEQNRKNG